MGYHPRCAACNLVTALCSLLPRTAYPAQHVMGVASKYCIVRHHHIITSSHPSRASQEDESRRFLACIVHTLFTSDHTKPLNMNLNSHEGVVWMALKALAPLCRELLIDPSDHHAVRAALLQAGT